MARSGTPLPSPAFLSHPLYCSIQFRGTDTPLTVPPIHTHTPSRPSGGLVHEEYRAFNNERRYQPKRNIIDGDVCEMFVEIAASKVIAVEGRPIEGAAKNPNHARITLAEQIVRLVNEELSMQAARSHQLGNSTQLETQMTNSSHVGSISVIFGRGNKYIQYTVESLLQIVEDMQSMH